MPEREKRVKRCIYGSGSRVHTERTERIKLDNLVLEFGSPVTRLKSIETLEVERCKTIALNRAEVSPAPFYP